jgi:multidrug transporter EmrE-like cation transporter
MLTQKALAGLLLMISCSVVANILLKSGASQPGLLPGLLGFPSARTVAGVGFFGCSLLSYMWVLRSVPLNVAQGIASAQFICVILASALVLDEAIPPLRWIGLLFISTGILLVAYSTRSSAG